MSCEFNAIIHPPMSEEEMCTAQRVAFEKAQAALLELALHLAHPEGSPPPDYRVNKSERGRAAVMINDWMDAHQEAVKAGTEPPTPADRTETLTKTAAESAWEFYRLLKDWIETGGRTPPRLN